MRRTGLVLGLLVVLVIMPTRLMAQSLDELYQQADVAYSAGNYIEFENVMRKGIQLYPNEARFYYGLGIALEKTGKKEDAIAAYRKAIELDPKLASAYTNLGIVLNDSGKKEEAITAFRKVIELDPKLVIAYYNLGLVLDDLGKKEEAIAAYRKTIELDPKFAIAYSNLGLVLSDLGKKEEAIIALRKAIELDPKLASAYTNLGGVLSDLRKKKEAIIALRKAIELDPKLAAAYYNLGNTLNDLGKKEEATIALRKAIELDPKPATAYSNLGNVLNNLGKKEEAIAAYRKAIELDPKFAIAYNNLGNVLNNLGKKEEAIAAYLKALSLPEYTSVTPTTAHTLAHTGLGLVYQQQGKLKEALAEYEAALKIDPKYEYAKNNRDAVLALLKQPTELAYTDTRYLRPDDPLTRPKRAVVLLTPLFPQGRYQQGTGFIIKRTDNKLWILTNRHVLTDTFYSNPPRTCDSVEVQIYPGDKPRDVRIAVLTSKVVLIANDLDLALIELEAPQLPADIQALAISDPSDNQPITTIGHPDKNPWQKDQGKVIDVDNEKLRLKISLAIGSSGSPVMTENYGVIGIIYRIDQEGTGYAIPINQIRKQLATWKVQLP
jgi:superkiller protein 3